MRKSPKIKTITICCSSSFYKQALEIEKELKTLGFKVKIPKTANVMKKTNNFDVSFYKTWYKDKKNYKLKTEFIKSHFRKILKSDAVLVLNYIKNGIDGYIGGNTLMEMTIAFHFKKPIYILNQIPEGLNIKEEIYGVFPIFINSDLTKIIS